MLKGFGIFGTGHEDGRSVQSGRRPGQTLPLPNPKRVHAESPYLKLRASKECTIFLHNLLRLEHSFEAQSSLRTSNSTAPRAFLPLPGRPTVLDRGALSVASQKYPLSIPNDTIRGVNSGSLSSG